MSLFQTLSNAGGAIQEFHDDLTQNGKDIVTAILHCLNNRALPHKITSAAMRVRIGISAVILFGFFSHEGDVYKKLEAQAGFSFIRYLNIGCRSLHMTPQKTKTKKGEMVVVVVVAFPRLRGFGGNVQPFIPRLRFSFKWRLARTH